MSKFIVRVTIIIIMIWILHPPPFVSKKKVLSSHIFMIAGIVLLDMWIFLNESTNALLLAGAFWTIGGGVCVVIVYILRSQKTNQNI